VAGQADRDRTNHAVGGVRRTAHHDGHVLIRVGFGNDGGCGDQLIGDDALAPFELPFGTTNVQISRIWRVQVMTCTESACAQNGGLGIRRKEIPGGCGSGWLVAAHVVPHHRIGVFHCAPGRPVQVVASVAEEGIE
jgi:hypothetical protein